MIIDNTIKFGYGDLLIYSFLNILQIKYVDKQFPCGNYINMEEENITPIRIIDIDVGTYDKILVFKALMDKVVSKDLLLFEFDEYTFDFSNWNEESVYVFANAIERLYSTLLIAVAA